ncbi:hypothetical protein [Microbacterium sp. P5_E9]
MELVTASAGYVDDAVAALQSDNVYVSPEVSGSAELTAQLEQQVTDASIAVVVFSDNASLEGSGPEIVAEIAAKTQYDTIIVAVGDDLLAGSHVLPEGEALRIANEAENATDTLEAGLTQTVQGVVAASDSAPPPADAGVGGGMVVALAIVVAALLAAGIGVVAIVRSRNSRADRRLPESVRTRVIALQTLAGEYAAVGSAGNPVAAQTGQEIAVIAGNVTELFTRLDKRSGADQRGIAAVEYDDKLRKLSAALDRDYLLDILTHPHLWDDPDERVLEVRGALSAVSDELVGNIKQVNASRGLHFQVSLDGLIGRRKELQEWDRAFGQASDSDPQPQ